jgi:hypothetical protein
MKRATELVRSYNYPDGEMFEKSNVIKSCFTIDIQDFTAFDNDLDQAYLDNLIVVINNANKVPQDNQVIDQLTQKTDIVEKLMDDCRVAAQGSKYFIEKAFPNNRSMWNEFGYNDYDEARKSQLKMILFMKVLRTVALTNKDALIAAGFDQTKIDEIDGLATRLDSANTAQQVFIKKRKQLSYERIEILNELWAIIQHICKVGKIIYVNDYGHYQQYVMYEKKSDTEPEVQENPVPEV